MPFRVALFGAGKWARNIVRVLGARDDVRLEAILVKDAAKARDWMPNAPTYDNVERLLHAHALDGAVICTPAATHADLCVSALGHGVPCFIEKPVTLSVADMARVERAALASSLPIAVDYIHLHCEPFQRLMDEIRRRGKPQRISALAGNPDAASRDCNILWDWGPHDVAMTLACLGKADVAVDDARIWPSRAKPFDSIRLELDWGGIPVRLKFSQHLPRKTRLFAAHFGDDTLVYNAQPSHSLGLWKPASGCRPRKLVELLSSGGVNALDAALDSFINKARKRAVDRDDLSSSVEVTRILELCNRSIAY